MFGVVMLGDVFNMRYSFIGGGMTVAFNDIVIFKFMFLFLFDFLDVVLIGVKFDEFYCYCMCLVLIINMLVNVLYVVFCSSGDTSMEEMR